MLPVINTQNRGSSPKGRVNEQQWENQMSDFGNVQNPTFAFYSLPPHINGGKSGRFDRVSDRRLIPPQAIRYD